MAEHAILARAGHGDPSAIGGLGREDPNQREKRYGLPKNGTGRADAALCADRSVAWVGFANGQVGCCLECWCGRLRA